MVFDTFLREREASLVSCSRLPFFPACLVPRCTRIASHPLRKLELDGGNGEQRERLFAPLPPDVPSVRAGHRVR